MGTYFIQTLGCQMNERDSETIAGLLEQLGYTTAAHAEDADVIVVNTCSVRENADNRFFGLLGRLKHVKQKRPDVIICVCGCMMQQPHIVSRIGEKHAWVDLIFGTHNIDSLPELIEEALQARKDAAHTLPGEKSPPQNPDIRVLSARGEIPEGLPALRAYTFKASVNIMVGCDNFCSYCIVPYTRGREMSRGAESILEEISGLAASGTKEILLLGQNVNSYAGKEGGAPIDFAALLDRVDKVPGVERIRFMTSHPKDLSDRLIERYRAASGEGLARLCPSIHLPVQAGSSRVLARMNRRYTKEDYVSLIAKLRAARPDIVVTTDFIVGFPGETEADFEETIEVIERVRFDSAFTFLFSPRKGTPAAAYKEQVDETVKHVRFERMVERLNAITAEKNKAYVGSVQEVLVEGASKTNPELLSGRTFGGKLVSFPPSAALGSADEAALAEPAGSIVSVRITSANTFSLSGEPVRNR